MPAIQSIKIKDFKAAVDVELADCDIVNVIYGENEQGKSSTVKAIEWALGGRRDDTNIVNNKAQEAVVTVEFAKSTLTRQLVRGSKNPATALISKAKGTLQDDPNGLISKKFPSVCFDPLAFLTMDGKKRVAVINAALAAKVVLKKEELEELGLEANSPDILEKLTKMYDEAYKQRTVANRVVKELKARTSTIPVESQYSEEDLEKAKKFLENLRTKKSLYDGAIAKKSQAEKARADHENAAALLVKIPEKTEHDPISELEGKFAELRSALTSKNAELGRIEGVIKSLEKPTCPLSPKVNCKTSMASYLEDFQQQAENLKVACADIHNAVVEVGNKLDAAKKEQENQRERDRLTKILEDSQRILIGLGADAEDLAKVEDSEIKEAEKSVEEITRSLGAASVGTDGAEFDRAEIEAKDLDRRVNLYNRYITEVVPSRCDIGIKDLVVTDKGISFRGIPFDDHGTSTQLGLLSKLMRILFPGEGVITIDRGEAIAPATMKRIAKAFGEDGWQLFISYVGDFPFEGEGIRAYKITKGENR